jgi:hypothetical protein
MNIPTITAVSDVPKYISNKNVTAKVGNARIIETTGPTQYLTLLNLCDISANPKPKTNDIINPIKALPTVLKTDIKTLPELKSAASASAGVGNMGLFLKAVTASIHQSAVKKNTTPAANKAFFKA